MSLIKLNNIVKTYQMGEIQVPVLRNLSLNINNGEMIALMGSSGSGKSTLMNILGCLDRPTSGEYWLENEEISLATQDYRANLRNKKIGFIFQNFNLLPRTTAIENVIMPLIYSSEKLTKEEELERAKKILTRVGLGDRTHHLTSQLSGGQQQRVAIARALINQPKILFADEPTGNLDSKTTDEILDMFKELHEVDGITIIIVTHEPEVALHTKRVIRLKDGQIEENKS